ncbi:MAG: hypothetical protein LBR10_00185 [Prevotellaceae bacterium]|jgi:predicted RND superfamily exporter protein|nr:hypothetical protein [Prevotellaceae bacterium]
MLPIIKKKSENGNCLKSLTIKSKFILLLCFTLFSIGSHANWDSIVSREYASKFKADCESKKATVLELNAKHKNSNLTDEYTTLIHELCSSTIREIDSIAGIDYQAEWLTISQETGEENLDLTEEEYAKKTYTAATNQLNEIVKIFNEQLTGTLEKAKLHQENSTVKDTAEVSSQPETEVSAQPETKVSGQPETKVSGQPETKVSGQPETKVSGQPKTTTAFEELPWKGIGWAFVITFVILFVMGITGKVVIYRNWPDILLSILFIVVSLWVMVLWYRWVGIALFAATIVWSCWRCSVYNHNIVLGIIVGVLRIFVIAVIAVLLFLAYFFSGAQQDKLQEAHHWKSYNRNIDKSKDAKNLARDFAIIATIFFWLASRFIGDKSDVEQMIRRNR